MPLAHRLPRRHGSSIRRIVHHFGQHVRPHYRLLLVAWCCMLGSLAMELLAPWPMKWIFDGLLGGHARYHLPPLLASLHLNTLLTTMVLSIFVIALLNGVCEYGQTSIMARVGQQVMAAIRGQLYAHIQRLSHSFHDRHHSADLLIRLTGDVGLIRELMIDSALYITDRLLVIVGMLAILLWKDWSLTLVALAVLPALAVVAFRFTGRIREATKRQRRKESQIASVISETFAAASVVKAYTCEQFEDARFSAQNASSLTAELSATKLESRLNGLVDVILALGTCGVLWLGVRRVVAGLLTPGDLVIVTSYVSSMYKPVRRLACLSARVAKSAACGERITAILDIEPEVADAPEARPAPRFRGGITFDGVHFWYDPSESVLADVSFSIPAGQTVALVGASGSGKSTIVNLLLRFYDVRQGRILIDGTPVTRYTLASLREQMALVFQEAILFNTTIRDNIAYGKPDATPAEIVAAATAANAHEFILHLERGYETTVGERGELLSGGQRQRIAIARAFIRNTPILLLDEPMTGLDVESESNIREALTRLTAGKTCLTITHDLQAVGAADHVLVLADGRIVEQGRHHELIQRSARYRQLCELQSAPSAATMPVPGPHP